MSWWIGTVFGPLANLVHAAWVEADTEPAAAQEIVDWFTGPDGRFVLGDDNIDIDNVFVIPADGYAVYDVAPTATGRSELQCCGGGRFSEHSGHCPLYRDDEEDEDEDGE